MKKTSLLFFTLFCAILVSVSCSSNNGNEPDYPTPTPPTPETPAVEDKITVDVQPTTPLPQTAGNTTIQITSSGSWTAVVDNTATWCTVNPVNGNEGTVEVKVSVAENETTESRSAIITFYCGKASATATISQSQKDAIVLALNEYSLGCEAQNLQFEVTSNVDYKIETSANWIAHAETRAMTTKTLVFSIAENTETEERSATITLSTENTRQVITVKQEGKLVNLVDLGLPSGTLWADMNIGATSIEQRGNHYAWGEIEPKDNYTWETYKFGTENALTKYCTQEWYGTVDNLNTLEACDDIATVLYGKSMHIPSIDQWRELESNCSISWKMVNNWGGYEVTGKNGNSIFLPVTGVMQGTEIDRPDAYGSGDYWSSTLCDNNNTAWDLDFDWGGFYLDDSSMNLRWHGKAIRACTK